MANYVLSCCSPADLSNEFLASRDIHYIGFHFYMNDQEFLDDNGKTMSYPEFYAKLKEGCDTRTSQVNVEEFVSYFTPFLEDGKDILHITLSSGISGVYNSAATAAQLLAEQYPDRKVVVVDSLAASTGYGMLVDAAADNRDAGMSIDENAAWLESHKRNLQHWFTSEDLSYYVKGGRISKASGWFGTMLKICPVMDVDPDGHLALRQKTRGRRASLNALVDKMEELCDNGIRYDGKVFLSSADSEEDAKYVVAEIQKRFPKTRGKVQMSNVGFTIGSHTGQGTIALFFWGKERT